MPSAISSTPSSAAAPRAAPETTTKIGVVLPQTEIGQDPAVIRDYAQAVEAMGYTHILAFDSVVGANPDRPGGWDSPYDYRHAFHEPFALFAFCAAVTRRVELVTGVLILPQRQTALVAKQAAEVDVLSGGRLRLGVGVGWNPVEFEALGENIHDRGKRIEEQLEVMRLLQDQIVGQFGWLTPAEFIDGLTPGQLTPGPILMLAAYVGYKVAGVAGAAVAAGAAFLPPFVLMLAVLPALERAGHSPGHGR
jgi:alkanesulfonate monooxygenase SsuD/methylene tetrahydromethanopterin reductase-like flavin-dependent oxidoreductase (luciferase family)